jgi:AmmeMemoRadiSam system protein A
LSHYPNYELANQVDQELIAAILQQDLSQFEQLAAEIDPDQNLQTRACGSQAIKIGLKLAEILNFTQTQLYDYQNSGDVTGDLSQVVGYAAIGFYGQVLPDNQNIMQAPQDAPQDAAQDENNDQAASSNFSSQALTIARQALEAYVNKRQPSKPLNLHPRLQEPLGVFVTLKKSGTLRGCIGLIESDEPLWRGIQKMAKAAALEDPRFPAVRPDELDKIEVEVSVLTKPVLVQDPAQVEAGKHGVIIRYGSQQGVFLPQVAEEQGYNREEFLNNLCSHKLGMPESCWRDPQAEIYVFEAEVYTEGNHE